MDDILAFLYWKVAYTSSREDPVGPRGPPRISRTKTATAMQHHPILPFSEMLWRLKHCWLRVDDDISQIFYS